MLKKLKNSRGFTLVELLVVMAIIAIIVTLIIYAINAARMQSRNTQRRNLANTAKAGLEAYYSTYKMYPQTANTATWLLTNNAGPGAGQGGVANYATGIPAGGANDPNGAGQDSRTCYVSNGNNRYWMRVTPEPQDVPACNAGTSGPYTVPNEDFSVQ